MIKVQLPTSNIKVEIPINKFDEKNRNGRLIIFSGGWNGNVFKDVPENWESCIAEDDNPSLILSYGQDLYMLYIPNKKADKYILSQGFKEALVAVDKNTVVRGFIKRLSNMLFEPLAQDKLGWREWI